MESANQVKSHTSRQARSLEEGQVDSTTLPIFLLLLVLGAADEGSWH